MKTLPTAEGPRDTLGRARADPAETRIYLPVCSSGGGTRTHNLRINSPPLCQIELPRIGHRCYRTHTRVHVYDAPLVTTDPVRARWAAGETAFAAWLSFDSPAAASVLASAGFDAVVVDLQHGHATLESLPHLLAAIRQTESLPFVRAAWNHPADLMRAFDLGARGVICPMIGSRAEAETFVAACRYPPAGIRSYGPIHAAFGRGPEQTTVANDAVLLFAMIETADGFTNLEEIAATPSLDGLFVGPADLSLGLGLDTFADLTDPALLTALDAILVAADGHGLVPGIHAPSPSGAAAMADRGFRFVSSAVDEDLLREAAEGAVRDARATRPAE
jgi:4-hydroxy-2-oxoheptanedioate aldolase